MTLNSVTAISPPQLSGTSPHLQPALLEVIRPRKFFTVNDSFIFTESFTTAIYVF